MGLVVAKEAVEWDFAAYFGFALAVTIPPLRHICHLHYAVYVLTVSLIEPQTVLKLKTTIYRSYEPCHEHIRVDRRQKPPMMQLQAPVLGQTGVVRSL